MVVSQMQQLTGIQRANRGNCRGGLQLSGRFLALEQRSNNYIINSMLQAILHTAWRLREGPSVGIPWS